MDSRVMDAQQLAFPDDAFDAVALHLILAVVPDPVACLHEAIRVLRPGGRAVIFDKFLPDSTEPSLPRRFLNVLTGLLFSDINRKLGPLLAAVPVTVAHHEPTGLGGAYQLVVLQKSAG